MQMTTCRGAAGARVGPRRTRPQSAGQRGGTPAGPRRGPALPARPQATQGSLSAGGPTRHPAPSPGCKPSFAPGRPFLYGASFRVSSEREGGIMRLCLSNGITGIRLGDGSTGVAGGRGGLGAEANNGSLRSRQLGRARPSPGRKRLRRGELPPSSRPGRPPGLAELPGRQAEGGGCQQTRKKGVVPSIDLCK